jgi:hypothetical protein
MEPASEETVHDKLLSRLRNKPAIAVLLIVVGVVIVSATLITSMYTLYALELAGFSEKKEI